MVADMTLRSSSVWFGVAGYLNNPPSFPHDFQFMKILFLAHLPQPHNLHVLYHKQHGFLQQQTVTEPPSCKSRKRKAKILKRLYQQYSNSVLQVAPEDVNNGNTTLGTISDLLMSYFGKVYNGDLFNTTESLEALTR